MGAGATETNEVFRLTRLMAVVDGEAARLGLGESDPETIAFPGLSLREATEIFTEAAYGRRLTFEHA